jgi:hypothetical protein
MAAMAVRVGTRHAILLARDDLYPAKTAYYLAHELAHIALGQLRTEVTAMVDLGDPLVDTRDGDEDAADRYALELLTGSPDLRVDTGATDFTGATLATTALASSPGLRIEPGTLALCLGHTTGRWETVSAAMRRIYDKPRLLWREVNGVAEGQLGWTDMSADVASFVRAVLGLA